MENLPVERNPADGLVDELIFEILRRLPLRSLCRCKCVCRSWRRLIADHGHRKKLPQTLSGFFYRSYSLDRFPYWAYHFTNVAGRGAPLIYPSFSFLPPFAGLTVLDCCNGLLLCRCYVSLKPMRFNYAVCNPATKEWVMLPDSSGSVAVDMDAKKWRRIPLPDVDGDTAGIHQSQGRLFAFIDLLETFKLSVWVLEDYNTDNWILKHTISSLSLFGGKNYRLDVDYQVIAAHPECNLIFFVYGSSNILMSYQMDLKKGAAPLLLLQNHLFAPKENQISLLGDEVSTFDAGLYVGSVPELPTQTRTK
uniref:F-box domain-containing protein n=1 Tax=Oryza brachyantha TaxID=4533 RepID=J3MLL8_ORYBR